MDAGGIISAASNGGAGLFNYLNNVTSFANLLGPDPNRISHERFMENETRADWHNEREIERQGSFLEGVAPSQAAAYNTMQDATQPQDTQRQINRVQQMSDALGMSPWELNNGSAGTPIPAMESLGPRSQPTGGSEFLGMLQPAAIAKGQQDTQLKIAKMQNQTSMQQALLSSQTALAQTRMQTAGGAVPEQQAMLAAQQLHNYMAEEHLTDARREQVDWETAASKLRIFLDTLPTQTINLGVGSQTTKVGGPELSKLVGAWGKMGSDEKAALQGYLQSLPKDQFSSLMRDIDRATTAIIGQAGKTANAVGGYLGGLIK